MNPNRAEQTNQFKTLLESVKSVAILLGENPSMDSIASALSWYLALSSQGKQVNIVSPTPMTVEFNRLVAIDKVNTSLSGGDGRNLVISFPYEEGSIEKVSYNIENETFNLVIEPREGYPMVTPEVVRYSYSGGSVDCIVTVDVPALSHLGILYQNNQNLFNEKPVVAIDCNPQNEGYGKINIIDGSVSSQSELTYSLFNELGFSIDSDIATNLLSGISAKTQNFTGPATTPSSFEIAAQCMRVGARKTIPAPVSSPPTPTQIPHPTPQPAYNRDTNNLPNFQRNPRPQNVQRPAYRPQPQNQPPMERPQPPRRPMPPPPQVRPPQPPPQPRPIQQPAYGNAPRPSNNPPQGQVQQPKNPTHQEAPPDWLKPKIYKGSSLV